MKALITGGTGFVGKHLVRELVSQGIDCRLLIRSKSKIEGLKDLDRIEFREADITASDTLEGIAEDIDYVYHLAAEGHVSAISEEAFRRFVEVNVNGTSNLLRECGKNGVKKFVHFSSTAAMGLIKKRGRLDETDRPQPETFYQKSKLESEMVALGLGKELGVPTVVLRPCMIYGVGGLGEFHKICLLMRRGLFPRVGLGRNLTPLVHVQDVVQGAVKAAEKGRPGEVYLLASEKSIDMSEMRSIIMEAWGTRAVYPYVPVWFMLFAAWCFEMLAKVTGTVPAATRRNIASTVWDREFSIEKARRDLQFDPRVSFRDGISETVEWFKSIK